MKGIIYKLHATEGQLDLTHGAFTIIEEVYVPELGLCFNSKGFAFKTDGSRYRTINNEHNLFHVPQPEKLKEIELESSQINRIQTIAHQRETVNGLADELFGIKPYENEDDE